MGNCFGFGSEGVRAGSGAARYQSLNYGGETPGGGWFACCQSRGARGDDVKVTKGTVCLGIFLSILGILLIAAGVIVGYYPRLLRWDPILVLEDVSEHEFLPSYQLMIAIGVFLLLATFACCCAKPATCCLLLVFIMVIVVVSCLSHSVSNFSTERVEFNVTKNMMAKMNSTDPIWDYIQQKLECCGVESPSDWQHNIKYNNATVPDSCCKVEARNCGQNYRSRDIFHDGCLNNMMDRITVYFYCQIGFLALFSLTAIFVICFCCCIIIGCGS